MTNTKNDVTKEEHNNNNLPKKTKKLFVSFITIFTVPLIPLISAKEQHITLTDTSSESPTILEILFNILFFLSTAVTGPLCIYFLELMKFPYPNGIPYIDLYSYTQIIASIFPAIIFLTLWFLLYRNDRIAEIWIAIPVLLWAYNGIFWWALISGIQV